MVLQMAIYLRGGSRPGILGPWDSHGMGEGLRKLGWDNHFGLGFYWNMQGGCRSASAIFNKQTRLYNHLTGERFRVGCNTRQSSITSGRAVRSRQVLESHVPAVLLVNVKKSKNREQVTCVKSVLLWV